MRTDFDIKDLLGPLKTLYAGMERAYDEVAGHYGFGCEGCQDNCCTQRFHHHTLLEYYFLMEGLKRADDSLKEKILGRARDVVAQYEGETEIQPLMCPVNFKGLCALYEYRPMICRLHGLPHSFLRPDGTAVLGNGCQRFSDNCSITRRLDRTGFYTELAGLEKQLRLALGFSGRYSKTTAEMLLEEQ